MKKKVRAKRITRILLATLLAVSMLPVSAFAAESIDDPDAPDVGSETQLDADLITLNDEGMPENLSALPEEEEVFFEETTDPDFAGEDPATTYEEDDFLSEEDLIHMAEGDQYDSVELGKSNIVTVDDAKDLTQNIIKSAMTGDPSSVVSWAINWSSGKIVDAIFGKLGSKDKVTLNQVMDAIIQLQASINTLQTTVDSNTLNDKLNALEPMLKKNTPYDVYDALEAIEKNRASGKIDQAEADRRVLSELTVSLGNGSLKDLEQLARDDNSFDNFSQDLWYTMTNKYHVNISGKEDDYDLMRIWYEHLRYKYHWEHQAYNEWAAFQTQSLCFLATTLNLERASLIARVKLLKEWNEAHPEEIHDEGAVESRLKKVQSWINQMAGSKYVDADGDTIKQKGIFSEEAWESKFWMFKKRDEKYRYYWTPGHETLCYSKVNNQGIPNEVKGACLKRNAADGIKIVHWPAWIIDAKVNTWYWQKKGFLRYDRDGNVADLISGERLKDIYGDYGEDKHLYDIFIGKDEGNFVGLDETGINKWWFTVNPVGKYAPWVKWIKDNEGQARVGGLTSGSASWDWIRLHSYSRSDSWMNHSKHYIGIGVVRYGPETYVDPEMGRGGAPEPEPEPEPEKKVYNTRLDAEGSAALWPSEGDMTVGFDKDLIGKVTKAKMDNKEIAGSDYSISGDKVTFKESYMKSLGKGNHKLVLTAENGSHTVKFTVKKKQSVSVKGAKKNVISKTYGNKAFDLGAKAKGDSKLTYKSDNTKVAKIDKNGKVTIKGAGKAKITITAEESKDYLSLEKTVTIKVSKGKQKVKVGKADQLVPASYLKYGAQTVKPITSVSKKGGKVTYKKISGPSGFTVNKKNGKVKVAQSVQPGVYKIKIRVSSAANSNYKAAHKDVSVSIIVK